MKKIFYIFLLLLSVSSFAQKKKVVQKKLTKTEIAVKRATTYFKNEYVPIYFKDKYSYQLKSAYAVEHSLGSNMEDDIRTFKREISYIDTTSVKFTKDAEINYRKMIEDKNSLENMFDNLPEEIKNKTETYSVFIDCYAANSFGNKVLGRYVVDIDDDGNVKEVSKWDN